MVHLARRRAVREKVLPLRVDDIIVRRDAYGLQHGPQVVRQGLAVSEAVFGDGGRRDGLESADSQLDAHIARMLTQVGIQHLQLLQVRPAVRRHLLQPGNQFLGKDIRPFLEGAEPAAEFLPVRLRSLRPAVLEGHGRRDDGRNEFPRRRHHHFPDQRREIRHRPGIMDTAFLFPDGKRLDVGGVTDNLRPLRKIEPVAGFHQFHPLVLQRGERRETDDSILIIN